MTPVHLRADAVRMYLARKSKYQEWLADRLGISSGYLSQLMAGARCPSPALRRKVLEQLASP